MLTKTVLFALLIAITELSHCTKTIVVVLLARNKEHTLPYFLTLFERLNYPKNKLSLFIRSDHNQDRTIDILEDWLSVHEHEYQSVDKILDRESPQLYQREGFHSNWVDERYENVIKMKEEGLEKSRNMSADFVMFLDVDAFLVYPNVLHSLIAEDKPIVSPLLVSDSNYSNFYSELNDKWEPKFTEEYFRILNQEVEGCFPVTGIHSAFLINLREKVSKNLTFNVKNLPHYKGPVKDSIIFVESSKKYGKQMFICNQNKFGFIPQPLKNNENLENEKQILVNLKLEVLVKHPPLPISPLLQKFVPLQPPKDKLGFDQIYMINIARRTNKRKRMLLSFDELGLDVHTMDAVDWQSLNESFLANLEVKLLDDEINPYEPMTLGLVANFLSHYFVWKNIIDNNYKEVIIFEDDVKFLPNFRHNVVTLMNELKRLNLTWELVYLERIKVYEQNETKVEGSNILVNPEFCYSALAYILSYEGAKKLMEAKPLQKMIPLDSFLPAMFGKFAEPQMRPFFPMQNLKAYSIEPYAVVVSHGTTEKGYITDTRNSPALSVDKATESLFMSVKSPNIHFKDFDIGKDEL